MFGRRGFLKMLGIGAAVAPVAAVLPVSAAPKLIPFKFSTTDTHVVSFIDWDKAMAEYNGLLGNYAEADIALAELDG